MEVNQATEPLNQDRQDGIVIGDLWGYITDANEATPKRASPYA